MKAIQNNTDGTSQLVTIEEPKLGPKDVLIQTLGCGLCGTDLLKINLKLLKKTTVLGHELVGRIVKKGAAVQDYNENELIVVAHHVPCFDCHYCTHGSFSMCDTFKTTNFVPGGFAEYICIPEAHLKHTTQKIPDNMPWKEAIFMEPLACCVRSIDRLPLKNNDTILIVGLGSIGLMMTKLLKRLDCHIIGLDIDPERSEKSLTWGVDQAFASVNDLVLEHIKSKTNNRGLDGIIFTAGPATMLNESLSWIRNGGFVNLFSHLSGEVGPLDTSELYHRELQIITSYSATPDSLVKSFNILKDENLGLANMFQEYPLQAFDQAVSDMNTRTVLKSLIIF
ncbi:MAG: alcohol dehydrogenase catalytic domain-containing protein [bacterium]|nr:alcohol dehydrogenase catalytic domain-containing protein [bacterium]MBU1916814.1 alcohol dehydrogenase catalytic domain-containing protein [bacterium]